MPETRPIDDLLEHAAFARRLARALVGDEARADDVVQQAWLNALEHPPRAGRGVKAWLATVVRNTASKLRRDESRREAREQRAAPPEPLPSAAEVAAQLAAQRELLDAVARLDEPGRSTIHARFFEGRTPTEIAAALGIPVRTVETRLRRAIERLRTELDERVEGGRRAWVGLLVGGSVVAIKTKSASAIGVAALLVATAATVVVTVTLHERADRSRTAGSPAAVAQATPPKGDSAPSGEAHAAATATPAVAATRDPLATVVTVVSPDGVEVAGASLLLFRENELLGAATTDANGAASLPIEEAPCRLLVFPTSAPAKVVEVPAKSPALEITYDEGVLFSGHVVVDGKPPHEPIDLSLSRDDGSEVVPLPDALPDAVWTRLRELRSTPTWLLSARTASDGAFSFFGLLPRVRLYVRIPAPYEEAATGATFVRLDEAKEGVELALRFNPSIRGRVVDPAGAPLAGWKIEAWTGSEGGCNSQDPVASDATGSFRVAIHDRFGGSFTYATLYVCDPSGAFERRVDVKKCVDLGCDVGDVVVDPRRVLAIDARDEAGRPIERFATVVERKRDAIETMPMRADRDVVDAARARAGLLLPEEVRSLRVVAPGRVAVDVAPRSAAAPIVATLPVAASLELFVHEEGGAPPLSAELELAASKWPAAWSRAELAAAQVDLGGSQLPWHDERDGDAGSLRLQAMKDGRFRALALLPRLPITLRLRDRLGAELLHEEIVLEPGEARVVERALAGDAVTLTGFVHEPDGTPIAKARIEVRTATGVDLAWTKADGRFAIAALRAPRVTLVFQGGGDHTWKWLRDLDVRAACGDLDVELKRGRGTHCDLVGQNGRAAATAVWIERAASRPAPDGADLPPERGEHIDGEADGSEGFAFPDLPEGPLLLRARVEGFTYALPVKPGCDCSFNATVRGPVEIDWSIAPATSNGRTLTALRLLPLRTGGARATLPIDAGDAARGSGLARTEKIAIDCYTVALVWRDSSGALTEEKSDVVVDVQRNESARVTLAR